MCFMQPKDQAGKGDFHQFESRLPRRGIQDNVGNKTKYYLSGATYLGHSQVLKRANGFSGWIMEYLFLLYFNPVSLNFFILTQSL